MFEYLAGHLDSQNFSSFFEEGKNKKIKHIASIPDFALYGGLDIESTPLSISRFTILCLLVS